MEILPRQILVCRYHKTTKTKSENLNAIVIYKAKCHFITHGAENKMKWKNVYINIYNQIFVINHVNKHMCMFVQ